MSDTTRIVRRTVNRDWSLKTVLHIRVSTFLKRMPHLNSCSLFADVSFPNLVLKIIIFHVNRIEYPKLSSCFVKYKIVPLNVLNKLCSVIQAMLNINWSRFLEN
jgi:hypothetical protein